MTARASSPTASACPARAASAAASWRSRPARPRSPSGRRDSTLTAIRSSGRIALEKLDQADGLVDLRGGWSTGFMVNSPLRAIALREREKWGLSIAAMIRGAGKRAASGKGRAARQDPWRRTTRCRPRGWASIQARERAIACSKASPLFGSMVPLSAGAWTLAGPLQPRGS